MLFYKLSLPGVPGRLVEAAMGGKSHNSFYDNVLRRIWSMFKLVMYGVIINIVKKSEKNVKKVGNWL